jgi:hypothetical protein
MHISETVSVALIAVAGTLGSGALSYLAAGRSTEVQLSGIRAEMERLRATHKEETRRERKEAYYALVTASHALKQFIFGVRGAVTEDSWADLGKTLGDEYIRVCFLGTDDVIAAADEMVEVFGKIAKAAEAEDEGSLQERLKKAFQERATEWNIAEGRLITTLKTDLEATRP